MTDQEALTNNHAKEKSSTADAVRAKLGSFSSNKGKIIQQPIMTLEDDEAIVEEDQRNWKGIGIALAVIATILGFVSLSVMLMSPSSDDMAGGNLKFTLQDVLGNDLSPRRMNGSWVSTREFSIIEEDGTVSLINVETLEKRMLMSNETYRKLGGDIHHFKISADRKFILILHDSVKTHRYSFLSTYAVFDIAQKELLEQVVEAQLEAEDNSTSTKEKKQMKLQLGIWGPKGNSLAFVYKNNIYFKESALSKTCRQLTTSGIEGIVFNGAPDWIYEEEILASDQAMKFSPSGNLLLFATFNDSEVDKMIIPSYFSKENSFDDTPVTTIRYPKPGRPNPTVTMSIADVVTGDIWQMTPPPDVRDIEHYVTTFTWIGNEAVCIVWMNRAQKMSVISTCKPPVWICEELHTERAQEKGWVDFYIPPIFFPDGTEALMISQVQDADFGFFRHVNYINVTSKRIRPITHGQFEVTSIVGWNRNQNSIYYVANSLKNPGERHLFEVGDLFSANPRMSVCLSCDIPVSSTKDTSARKDTTCLFNNPVFSPDLKYLLMGCNGPDVPHIDLYKVAPGKLIPIQRLQNNSHLRELMAQKSLPRIKNLEMKVSGNYRARIRLFLPPDLDEGAGFQYPIVLQVYSGPGTQLVSEEWKMHWGIYLASQREYIYAWVDGKGSGFQGDMMETEVYYRLGTVEVDDQIQVVSALIKRYPFIDPDNVAVWGWAYGGYVATSILVMDKEDVFKCGIAVAPITNWLFYDSVFSERYMGSPNVTDNLWGYRQSDVTKRAGNMKGKLFYLIHGTADDNVHFQHSMALSDALVEAGVLFKQLVYADENHELSGGGEKFLALVDLAKVPLRDTIVRPTSPPVTPPCVSCYSTVKTVGLKDDN
ncbi:unnamed protein product [Cyprideis torosa]|uniref:Venom dipeptidyl peptidase 4 n=1 Tax=Cyprideis torosa TaxID=163714 RepID=A0A7R8W2U2_9CRUS|nr:unnamed protein product [Cyprideis torosa]CAG0882323.1 unnamed protein product [Cyprideis torosa]